MTDRFWLWLDNKIEDAKLRNEISDKQVMSKYQVLTDEQKAQIAQTQKEALEHLEKNTKLSQEHFMVLWPFITDQGLNYFGPLYESVKVGDTVAMKVAYRDDECLAVDLVKVESVVDGRGITTLPEGVKPLDSVPMLPSDVDLEHLFLSKDTLLLPSKRLKAKPKLNTKKVAVKMTTKKRKL